MPPAREASSTGTARQIPTDRTLRDRILDRVERAVAASPPVPPLPLEEIRGRAAAVCRELGLGPAHQDFVTVLVGNAIWRPTVAAVPPERRLLLLPQCLRRRATCPATVDAVGLLCEGCGACPIAELEAAAEARGSVVLVAEGTTVVSQLLETGQVDAVIGVGCLDSLERLFPHADAAAVPALAIPLLGSGCDATAVDLDWVRRAVGLDGDATWPGELRLETLRSEVGSWFHRDHLSPLLQVAGTRTERKACNWLAAGGKRWRPTLLVAVERALSGPTDPVPDSVRRLAVAVECFHKASLAHDDIEDDDELRYGEPTLHAVHGTAIALNLGDLLVGEGYRLVAGFPAAPAVRAEMVAVAAAAHRELCLGQGAELEWACNRCSLSPDRVLDIFRRKTAPAFEVAMVLGALAGGADSTVVEVLRRVSVALGVAYQIRDDIDDFYDRDREACRPSLLLALAHARGMDLAGNLPRAAWLQVEAEAWGLVEKFKAVAVAALAPLRQATLKRLLHRLIHRVLGSPPSLARTSHQVPAAAGDALHPAALSRFGVLNVLKSTPPRPLRRKHHCAQHLAALATKPGEMSGPAVVPPPDGLPTDSVPDSQPEASLESYSHGA